MLMTVWGGQNFVSAKSVLVEQVASGVGKIACLECHGDPNYPHLFPPEIDITQCIDCKGRG